MLYNFYRTIKGDVRPGELDKDGNPRTDQVNVAGYCPAHAA